MLNHLFPDFTALFSANSDSISAWFCGFTLFIFSLSVYLLIRHYRQFSARMSALNSLVKGQSKEELALNRRETLQKAQSLSIPGVKELWVEFDESLVLSSDQTSLFNTLDAEHFFNARSLACGLTASRLLAAAPSFLVAIGVLGTFVGLTIGLEGLVGTSNEIEALKGGINILISGAAVAFMTSVWGVFFSLLLNLIEKLFERSALSKVNKLQHDIDKLYTRLPAEQSLVHIAEYGKESKEALQELHERIGDRLQETLNGMSESMQAALSEAIHSVMAPAVQTLVNSTSQQSSQVLDALVGNFMEGMASAGREQGQQMQQAAAGVNTAIINMGEQLDHLFGRLSEQQAQQVVSTQQQNSAFEMQLQRMSSAAEEREISMEARFNELLSGLSTQQRTQQDAAELREQTRQQRFQEQQERANENQQALLSSLANTMQSAQQQSRAMANQHQQQLEQRFTEMSSRHQAQQDAAEQREQARQQRFSDQQEQITANQQELLASVAAATLSTQEQSRLIAEQHQQLLSQLKQAAETTMQSSKHLDNSANQLGMLSVNLREASGSLGQRLEAVSASVESAGQQNANLASQLQHQATTLAQLQSALVDSAQRFEQAADIARSGFGEMKSSQAEFLEGVRHEFSALGETLREQVEVIEKQAEEWLRNYSREVRVQTDERMNAWNEKSIQFAESMSRAVSQINNVLDELEAR